MRITIKYVFILNLFQHIIIHIILYKLDQIHTYANHSSNMHA
jgi:hypothetical protein